jgi:hypothetical protein
MFPVHRFSLADLFDAAGRLRPFEELAPELQEQIASFDVIRTTIRQERETVTTEELIRVRLRDNSTAEISQRATTASAKVLRCKPLSRRVITTHERSAGSGRTAAADEQHKV